ncbi:MAG: beta-phosphoglucomutase [Prolixibacteraceae bacterium]|nr:beta-phosphoglucomutase [Prolixibacteraceae bacterium]
MSKIKACIFDLDGVIVDTARYHYIAWKEIAQQLGFEFTLQHNERLKGVSRMTSLDILLEIGGISMDENQKETLAKQKNDRYVSLISKMTPDEILPGVVDFLIQLKNDGIKTAIGSASKNTPMILERLDLAKYFDAVIDGNSVSQAKPDPEVFLKGAQALNIRPYNCVVFEDASAGVEAAVNGGMMCVGIGDAETLAEADFVIPGFKEFSFKQLKEMFDY